MAFRDKHIIKIITGIRRCRKSTLMEIYQDALRSRGAAEEQIVAVNFEDFDFRALRQREQLHAYIKARITPGKMTYVFLDEIQHMENWPEVIDSLFLRKELDLYLTGPMPICFPVR